MNRVCLSAYPVKMGDMGQRLREARERKFKSAAKAAAALGVPASSYRAHENGQNQYSKEEAKFYARRFDVSAPWLLYGETSDAQHLSPALRGDVASLNIHAGMGNGGALSVLVEDGEVIDPASSDGFWSFPDRVRSGFRQIRRTYAIPVTGDSMEPTIPSDAYVFVDTTHVFPSPDDIYAIDCGDGLVVKRVKLIPKSDRIRVISDNPRYGEDELLREDVRVYGRVIAFFQWR